MEKLKPTSRSILFSIADGKGSPVPAASVKEFLQHLQTMVYNIAEMRASKDPAKPGKKGANIHDACDLRIIGMEFSSATFLIEPPPQKDELFHFDIGFKSLQDAFEVFKKVGEEDTAGLSALLPEPKHRKKIIANAQAAIPKKKTGFYLSATSYTGNTKSLSKAKQEFLKTVMQIEEDENLEATAGVQKKLIDAKGIAVFGPDDEFQKWDEIYSLEDWKALILEKVDGTKYSFVFTNPIPFEITEEDSLTLLKYQPLNILVSGTNIQEAVSELGATIDFLWNEYVLADQSELHASGLSLKESLLAHIKETPLLA